MNNVEDEVAEHALIILECPLEHNDRRLPSIITFITAQPGHRNQSSGVESSIHYSYPYSSIQFLCNYSNSIPNSIQKSTQFGMNSTSMCPILSNSMQGKIIQCVS